MTICWLSSDVDTASTCWYSLGPLIGKLGLLLQVSLKVMCSLMTLIGWLLGLMSINQCWHYLEYNWAKTWQKKKISKIIFMFWKSSGSNCLLLPLHSDAFCMVIQQRKFYKHFKIITFHLHSHTVSLFIIWQFKVSFLPSWYINRYFMSR